MTEQVSADEALEAEFNTVAAWTEAVIADLGADYAIPAACRGSGSVTWFSWLADRLQPRPDEAFLDAGAGLGGPAAWLRENRAITPVLAEPMVDAAAGSRRLFGLPSIAAWSQDLPFRDETFEAAWLLGVLCTTAHKRELLTELNRILRPDGRLGLLAFVQVAPELPIQPEGNHFPTTNSLRCDLEATGFDIVDDVPAKRLPASDDAWQQRVTAVEDALQSRFGDHPAWRTAFEQTERMTLLLYGGAVEPWLLTARRSGRAAAGSA